MNSPAPHSFNWPKLGNRTPVSIERNKELESRLAEMQIWKERCLVLERDKRISQWMDFDIAEYTDILFAIQMGNVRINYDEQSFDDTGKSIFNEQKKNSLDEMKKFVNELQNAKTYWHTHFEPILRLLNETINITEMIRISPEHTVTYEIQQSNHSYEILRKQCTNLFAAADILIQTNKSLSSISLDTIANLCNIRIFKNPNISRLALNMFYRAEEVRLLLQEKPGEAKESSIAEHFDSLSELKEKVQNPNGMDALKGDTNSLICQAIWSRYMETISEQLDIVWGILREYEMKCWKYTDILKWLQKEISAIDSSRDLLQVFVAIERITGKYGKNIRILSDGYSTTKGLGDVGDIIKKFELLHTRIQGGLIKNIRYNYQNDQNFELNPILSVGEAITQTDKGRNMFQDIYYALIKIIFDEKDILNDIGYTLMEEVISSHKKIASIDWKKYKVSLHSSAKERLSEHHKHPFYKEMIETLELVIVIYIGKVEKYIKDFSDPNWGVEDKKKSGDKKSKEDEKEDEKNTLASLLDRTVKRVAEKKKK